MRRPAVLLVMALALCCVVSTCALTSRPQGADAGAGLTPTPVAPKPGIRKQPEGNVRNINPSVPAANLWLCERGSCAGPGEGSLRVVEQAFGVAAGLGAYEFTVQFDETVIQSINPCDIVFGASGAGSSRGPVLEASASAVNMDCVPGAGTPKGSCGISILLEGLVHFGCATGGQAPGPIGTFPLASLVLVPHPDFENDVLPVTNNGIVTIVGDNSCELVTTLGEPMPGSVNGGLTPYCRDLAVTVRILEADFDLDCDVDAADAQAITSRYGAFFGGMLYDRRFDMEPAASDSDIDIKDVQKVYGRQGSTCQLPLPAQAPRGPEVRFKD